MKKYDASKLPSDKNSKKFFLLSENQGELPFTIVPLEILTPNGQKLVADFWSTKGEFLGGGVMKSPEFEDDAQKSPQAMEIYQRIKMQSAFMSYKEVVNLSTKVTSEWIAFEYSLVISITMYGYVLSIKWDHIDQIKIKRKGMLGQATAQIVFKNKKKEEFVRTIQSSVLNIKSLGDIARACGVTVK
jgi:hypothetical protein